MSDAPLFQNIDEQEKAYAPGELPEGSGGKTRADVDDADKGAGDSANADRSLVVPVVAGGVSSGGAGAGLSGGVGGGTNPAIGAAALDGLIHDRDNPRDDDA